MSVKLEKASAASNWQTCKCGGAPSEESIMDRPVQPFLIKNPISVLKGIALALTN